MIGVIETDKGKRVEQILATDVTREQLADAVWSMERTHASQNGFIMELMERCNYYEDMSDKLRDENARLRELVQDMYGYAANREMELCNECACADDGDCGACDEYDGACGIAKRRFEELYASRICELGIEVGG